MIATAPGKLMLSGEYAVLGGAPSLLVAVDRRAVASLSLPRHASPFLDAVAVELCNRGFDDTVPKILGVDSAAFYDAAQKLGLGSSAAVTVAATALAWASSRVHDDRHVTSALVDGPRTENDDASTSLSARDLDEIHHLASAAHAAAQAPRGARGSGADIAVAVYGGTIVFERGNVRRVTWPAGVVLLPFFTGRAADTASLVSQVEAARASGPEVDLALAAITRASRTVCELVTGDPVAFLAALDEAADAIDGLSAAARIDLVPTCVREARQTLARFGGTAKTTGAGGGDVAIAALPVTADVALARRALIEAGCQLLDLSLDAGGVDLRPSPQ